MTTGEWPPDEEVKEEFDKLIAALERLTVLAKQAKERYCLQFPKDNEQTKAIYDEMDSTLAQANIFDDHIRSNHPSSVTA